VRATASYLVLLVFSTIAFTGALLTGQLALVVCGCAAGRRAQRGLRPHVHPPPL